MSSCHFYSAGMEMMSPRTSSLLCYVVLSSFFVKEHSKGIHSEGLKSGHSTGREDKGERLGNVLYSSPCSVSYQPDDGYVTEQLVFWWYHTNAFVQTSKDSWKQGISLNEQPLSKLGC